MVSESKILGLLAKYHHPNTPQEERDSIREKLIELKVDPSLLQDTSRALVPSNGTSGGKKDWKSKLAEFGSKLAEFGSMAYAANQAMGDPAGPVIETIKEKIKDYFSGGKNKKTPIESSGTVSTTVNTTGNKSNAVVPKELASSLSRIEHEIIGSSTVYPRMFPSSMYKPMRKMTKRVYESMLPRRRYRRGMFGHNVYNNMGFFNSFISPSNRQFYF